MQTFVEPIRYSTSLFALVTLAVVIGALRRGAPIPTLVWTWAVLAGAAGLVFTHVVRGVPAPAMVPAVATVGLGLAVAGLFTARVRERFDRLDDQKWRTLMLLRAVFGALLLASGAAGIMPAGFALPAGLGDLLVGGLALAAPGSLAAGGHRGSRLLVFGVGLADFASVIALQVLVLVPWLARTGGLGISLLLPWVAVPALAAVNLHGMRRLLVELLDGARRARPSVSV